MLNWVTLTLWLCSKFSFPLTALMEKKGDLSMVFHCVLLFKGWITTEMSFLPLQNITHWEGSHDRRLVHSPSAPAAAWGSPIQSADGGDDRCGWCLSLPSGTLLWMVWLEAKAGSADTHWLQNTSLLSKSRQALDGSKNPSVVLLILLELTSHCEDLA